jgi:hypothetical protein
VTAEPVAFPALVNGSFEEARDDGTPYGWRKFGGELALSDEVRVEGDWSAAFTSRTSSTKWIYQTVRIDGGAHYRLTASARKADPAADSVFLRLSWYASDDGKGRAIASVDSTRALGTDDPLFRELSTGIVEAPRDARSAKVRLMLRSVSAAAATVYFDRVGLVEAEPTSPVTALPEMPEAESTSTPALEPLVFDALVNGGFEKARDDGTPYGWRKIGGEVARSEAERSGGIFSAALTSRTASTKWIYQTVAVNGGSYYRLSAQVHNPDAGSEAAFLRVSWYATEDGGGRAIGASDSLESRGAFSPAFVLLETDAVQAPPEARTAKVRLMHRPLSEQTATVYFDDVSFESTSPFQPDSGLAPAPTPASIQPVPLSQPADWVSGGLSGNVSLLASSVITPANVRAVRAEGATVTNGRGRSVDWAVALALTLPAAALALTASSESRRRLDG